MANVAKYKTMTCQPGAIFTGMSEEAFNWRITGEGAMYRDHIQRHIPCTDCRVELTARYMTAHYRILHGKDTAI